MGRNDQPALSPLALEFCPACRERKDIREFHREDPNGPVVCQECVENGVRFEDPFSSLGYVHRQAVRLFLAGWTDAEVSRQLGFDKGHISRMRRGESMPEVRQAFMRLLTMEGLDYLSIARGFFAATQAVEYKYNKEQGAFEAFPDNNTRLRAWQGIAKLLQLEEPASKDGPTVNVVIEHNLGGAEGRGRAPGELEYDAPGEKDVTPRPKAVEAGEDDPDEFGHF